MPIFQSGSDWDNSPTVVNGASDLFVKVLEEKGIHSRAIFELKNYPEISVLG